MPGEAGRGGLLGEAAPPPWGRGRARPGDGARPLGGRGAAGGGGRARRAGGGPGRAFVCPARSRAQVAPPAAGRHRGAPGIHLPRPRAGARAEAELPRVPQRFLVPRELFPKEEAPLSSPAWPESSAFVTASICNSASEAGSKVSAKPKPFRLRENKELAAPRASF